MTPRNGDSAPDPLGATPGPEGDSEGESELPKLPFLEESIEFSQLERTPTWRGWIHAGTFPVALALGIVLVFLADGTAAKASTSVFFATSLLLFGTSALYHRIDWSPKVKAVLRRIDHSNIFLLIAGTYTPVAALALPRDTATLLLWFVWVGAGLGILFRIFWLNAPRWLYVPLYLLLGYAALGFMFDLFDANAAMMTLVLAGGLCYSLGAAAYALKKPNPVPGVFGFHEVFHAFTLLAFLCHWAAVLLVALHPITN